jgi:hypothetical protein
MGFKPLSITGRASGCTNSKELTMIRTIRMLLATTALVFSLAAADHARAEYQSYGLHFPDNNSGVLWVEGFIDNEDPTKFFIIIMFKDGDATVIKDVYLNPGPDDDSVAKGDLESRTALAKQQGGGNWIEERAFWDSPLGRHLAGKGKGPDPVINPGGDDVGGGPGNPSLGKEKLGDAQIIDHTAHLGSGKGGGFHVNAGSPGEQLKKPGGPGGPPNGDKGDGGDDDKGSSKPPPGTYFGPADLVDPLGPWVGKGAAKAATRTNGKSQVHSGAAIKRAAGPAGQGAASGAAIKRTAVPAGQGAASHTKPKSSPMAAGLLDNNAGFSPRGPAALGAAFNTRVR